MSGNSDPIDIKTPLIVGGGTAGALWLVQKFMTPEDGPAKMPPMSPMTASTLLLIGGIAAGASMVEPYLSKMLDSKSS